MFVSPVDKFKNPGKKAWENFTIFDNDRFYAFFGTGHLTQSNPSGRAIGIDIAVSHDGVHWRFIGRDLVPIPGAHAGFGVIRIANKHNYYPTCSTEEKGVHFKIYQSEDLLHWKHLGDRYDVVPDCKFYRERWDEIYIIKEQEGGRGVYLGYISSEVRDDVGAPSTGMLKSFDGINWEVLPPPVIEWGELPSQHMELNFCERIGTRFPAMRRGFYSQPDAMDRS